MVLFKTDEEKRIEEERKLKEEEKHIWEKKKVQWKSWTDSSGFKFFWIMGCSR